MMKNFEFISREEKQDSEQTRRSLTYWQDVWRRLKNNKLSMAGLVAVIMIVLFGAFGPFFVEGDYSDQINDYSNLPPRLEIYQISEDRFVYITREYRVLEITEKGKLIKRIDQMYRDIPNRMLFFADEYDIEVASPSGPYADPGNLGADVFYSEAWGIGFEENKFPNQGEDYLNIVYVHPNSPFNTATFEGEAFDITVADAFSEIILTDGTDTVSFTNEDDPAEIIAALEANNEMVRFRARGEIISMDYGIGLKDESLKPAGYEEAHVIMNYQGNETFQVHKTVMNRLYPWGTDELGRNVLSRVMYGARISLIVALVATLVNFFVGVLYGSISGYVGGTVDNIMMRIVDIINSVPLVLYVILLMVLLRETVIDITIFGRYFVIFRGQGGLGTIIIALGSVYWVGMARLVRGQVLGLKEQEYVLAARTIGVSNLKIIWRHLIPNAMGPIVVSMTMMIPSAVFTEAFLSFIGLGLSAPLASWGTLANDALQGLTTYPYQLFFPAGAIAITMLAFNFLGDGLRDALDPRLRKG
jgi:ABC-type dipeptide/oligopeptide/nickel transport system permease subunit